MTRPATYLLMGDYIMKLSTSHFCRPFFRANLLVLFLVSIMFNTNAITKDFENSSHHEYPEWFEDNPFNDLAETIEGILNENNKGMMVLFTTKNCSYCEQFIKRSLGNPDIAQKVQDRFASIGMEIFDDAEMITPSGESIAIKKFAKQQGVEFAPTLLFFDNKGKRILRQVGYQAPERFLHLMNYVADKHYQTTSLSDFLNTKAPQKTDISVYTKLKENSLFDTPPYALDRSKIKASEPLMILFEKTGCDECEAFHNDVLKSDDVRKGLDNFQTVRLDANDDKTRVQRPNGEFTTPAQWFKKSTFSRLPALMFFNESGNLSLQTDAYVMPGRMLNSINFMREKAYDKGWTYQQFARSKGIEKSLQKEKNTQQ